MPVSNSDAHSKIKDSIMNVLSGGTMRNALDFAEYLHENEMITGGEHGAVMYKDKVLCYIYLDGSEQAPGPWTVWTEGDYSNEHRDVPMDENMKETAWANVNFCGNCGGDCSPGKHKTILGKEFDSVCSADMAFNDPNANELECLKKLLEMRKYQLDLD